MEKIERRVCSSRTTKKILSPRGELNTCKTKINVNAVNLIEIVIIRGIHSSLQEAFEF